MNIWQKLKKPILILAPMEDVTDTVFRRIIMECGRPSLFFTEFTNVDGMCSDGDQEVSKRLLFTPKESPIIAQVWGMNPENYFKAAKRIAEMGYDGIDINMGCPQKAVVSRGACSALIKNQALAKEIIQATKEGAKDLPVSVKTRIGFKTNALEEWISFLLSQDLVTLTIHARTAAEMSKVPAHWEEMPKAVALKNKLAPHTILIGNGDVTSLEDAKIKAKQYGLDGIMIGRGVFTNPWIFNPKVSIENISPHERIQLLIKHVALYEKTWGKKKNYQILKKYFKIYASNFPGAQDLRIKLMETENGQQVEDIISAYTKENSDILPA